MTPSRKLLTSSMTDDSAAGLLGAALSVTPAAAPFLTTAPLSTGKSSSLVTRWIFIVLLLTLAMGSPAGVVAQTVTAPEGLTFPSDARILHHPLPPDGASFAAIDGERLKGYVREQVEISRRYRDAGNQFWGRIIGTAGDEESAEWLAERLRTAGAVNVRIEPIQLAPQWLPRTWRVVASGENVSVELASAWPAYESVGTGSGVLDLEAVHVGWGYEADFAGRDVRGKAAIIYSAPYPSAIRHSASLNGALRRAEEHGAAAVFVVIELPGNMRYSLFPPGIDLPTFALGAADGAEIRRLIEAAAGRAPARVRLNLDVEMVPGLATANVWGEIPGADGATEEDVLIVAHRDAFFDGAGDNGTGVATAIGIAEYFAAIPRERRRRTIRIIGTPGHHDVESIGQEWLQEHRESLLRTTALLINAEHTTYTLVDRWGPDLVPTNIQGPFAWTVHGSGRLRAIVDHAFDTFGVPRWSTMGGPTGEFARVRTAVPSTGLMHAATLLHTDAESVESIPAAGLAAVTRAYAKIIQDIEDLERDDLLP